jgi:hypothetical protein
MTFFGVNKNYLRRSWFHCLAAVLLTMTVTASARAGEWKTLEVRQLGEKTGGVRLPAKLQIVTERWNRVAAVPYIVYMPEKDRLLMLVSCDDPHHAEVLFSDDRGATWSPAVRIAQWKGANEVALLRAANGHLVAACRTIIPVRLQERVARSF